MPRYCENNASFGCFAARGHSQKIGKMKEAARARIPSGRIVKPNNYYRLTGNAIDYVRQSLCAHHKPNSARSFLVNLATTKS